MVENNIKPIDKTITSNAYLQQQQQQQKKLKKIKITTLDKSES